MAGFITLGPAAVVLAALDSSAASTTAAGPKVITVEWNSSNMGQYILSGWARKIFYIITSQ